MATKIYKDIQRVSDLRLSPSISDNMEVLLAHLRKNYKTSLNTLNQNAIIGFSQAESKKSGVDVPISLLFKDNSIFRIIVKNGTQGIQGRRGKQGIEGDKGDNAVINKEYAEGKNVIDWLTIANDCLTNDSDKVFSAFQGVKISEALKDLSETFLSEYQYALLFTDHITIDAEFETFEDNQLVQLIAEDPATHQRYIKYWTFESEGEQEYFILNYFAQTYDSVYADIWGDIYLGGKTGFFEASSNQLLDGTPLYIKNDKTNSYEEIKQFTDTIYIINGTDENGQPLYVPSSLTETEGPWFIKRYIKKDGEYIENYSQVTQEYINENISKSYGQKDFLYYLKNADCTVKVNYTRENGYDFNLYGNALPENIYIFDKVDDKGNNLYKAITFADVNPDSPTVYYKRTKDNKYETIGNIKDYIKKKAKRVYKLVAGIWTEIEVREIYRQVNEETSIFVGYEFDIDTDKFEEYIEVDYTESTNTNKFTHYSHVKTLRDEYYKVETGVLNPYSITYYVKYTDEEPRRYFTRRIITTENDKGETVFDYQYKEIIIPFWLEAEFTTYVEDQNIRLLSNNPEVDEIGDVEVIDPVYISSIEFEDNVVEIAKNMNKDIKVDIYPENANVTDMILEYDDSIINIYEDGRIAALTNDEITKETIIKVYSERDNQIGDEIKVRIVTPIEKIELEVESINLYSGSTFTLNPIIYPNQVSNSKLVYSISDSEMITIDKNNVIRPKLQSDGKSYKTGTCELTITADDGFGASLTVPILVATPIQRITIDSRAFGFIGIPQQVETTIYPDDATLKILNYSSSDESIFTIDERGLLKPLSEGEAELICSAKDGSGVTATQKMKISTGVNKINVTGLDDSIEVGLYNDIEIEVLPINASDNRIHIYASNDYVIDYTEPVLKEGTKNIYTMRITGFAGGTTQFNVMTLDGSDTVYTKDLIIPIPIEKISFEEPNVVIYEGDEIKVIRTVVTGPESVQNADLDWLSSDESIVTVDTYGRITPVKMGKAKISAISKDNNKVIGTCNVIVKKHTQDITLNINSEIKVLVNNYAFVSAIISPYDASDQILRWKSSNEAICTVEDNGTIYGKSVGSTIVTVSPIDRTDISKTFTVEVVRQMENETNKE